ncbi:MAG: hypothetical protein M3R63_11610 [Actinomycetota bacterium]|nr:hypothetical protein [Actinomycetota bacterium]
MADRTGKFCFRFACRDGSGRPGEVLVFVREGALVVVAPAGESAVFAGPELLGHADELRWALLRCLVEVARMRSGR